MQIFQLILAHFLQNLQKMCQNQNALYPYLQTVRSAGARVVHEIFVYPFELTI